MPRKNVQTFTATANAAVATATAPAPGESWRWRIAFLHASVEAGVARLLVVTDAGGTPTTLFQGEVAVGGPIDMVFGDNGPNGDPNEDITATLSSAGAGNDGSITLGVYLEG